MKRYINNTSLENIYGMSRVGTISSKGATLEIYVNTNDAGKIPHFHLRDMNEWNRFHTCIRIDKPEYFIHENKQDTLTTKEAKELNEFMISPTRKPLFNENGQRISNWEYICMLWDDNNSDVMISEDVVQLDYSQLT